MKKSFPFPAVVACLFALTAVNTWAGESTVSAGYAQGNFKGVANSPEGANVKLRYEYDNSAWGSIGSLTYLEHTGTNANGIYSKEKYGSVSAGPIYRFNHWASIYGLLGIGAGSRELTRTDSIRYGVTYGAGVQFNPLWELALDVSYEQNRINSVDIGSWMVGIGYRF